MNVQINEDNLKNIIMKCNNENVDYKNPTMIKNNKKIYAYVTLVMLGDLYISGAIVLAYSIKKLGSQADCVVLVTPDVSAEGKTVLSMYFDHVIDVQYVDVPNWRTKDNDSSKKYLSLVFTKFNVFNLTQYEKILLIDADALVLKYPDHLFSLDAPAGCLLENKDLIISYDENGNYVLPKDGQFEWYKKMCDCCGHGKLIPKQLTDKVLTERGNSGIGGGLLLLKPTAGEFQKILNDVSHGKMKYLVQNKFVWPEQQYLTARYSGKWTSINPRFFGLQGYPHWKILYGLQYGGDKPFKLSSKIDIKLRTQYPDYILWHTYYDDILQNNPKLYTSIPLAEANEMHRYFYTSVASQSRLMKRIERESDINDDIQIISKLYTTNIHNNHLDYYHRSTDIEFRPLQIQPMWSDIGEYDYFEPIRRLAKYHSKSKNNYYSKIFSMYGDIITFNKERLDLYNQIDPIDMDLIMLQFIKCRQHIHIATIWKQLNNNDLSDILTYMSDTHNNIYYIKTIVLSKKGLINLLLSIHDDINYNSRLEMIKNENFDDTNNYVTVIFFESTNGSPVHRIRNKLTLYLQTQKNIQPNYIYINDYFYQTIEHGQIYLNLNNIDLLRNQNFNNLFNIEFCDSLLKINTLKKWLFANTSLLEMDRFIFVGDIVLSIYGIKKCSHIDGIYSSIGIDESRSELEFAEIINADIGTNATKISFLNCHADNYKYHTSNIINEINHTISYFDINNISEIVTDPRNYMFFNGLKIYLLKYEIIKKIFSDNLHSHSDLFMLSSLYSDLVIEYVTITNDINLKCFMKDNKIQIVNITHEYLKKMLHIMQSHYTKIDFVNLFHKYETE